MKLQDYQIIDGKPYGATFFARSFVLNENVEYSCNPRFEEIKEKLMQLPEGLLWRENQIIYRPPYNSILFFQNATLAVKGLVFGRAFRIHRLFSKGMKRRKKCYVCGRRRIVYK
jgi:hypothetical protein